MNSFSYQVILCLYVFAWTIQSESITINTQLGHIRGNTVKSSFNPKQEIYSFLGIQYGVSPVGALRFRPSTLNESKWNGIYDGTKFGASCMQGGASTQSENCLLLNVWTPQLPNNQTKADELLPVMFWIHGGGFKGGSGSGYDGTMMVAEAGGDFVYVSINYRLNAFGFLSSPQLYAEDANWPSYGGLNGVNDQIMALKYAKKYISDYGGDPNQITIFGESAGGQSVCYLTISPLAKGLFNRAIIESGACGGPWGAAPLAFGTAWMADSIQEHGYPNNIDYLRYNLSAQQLLKIDIMSTVDTLVLTEECIDSYRNLEADTLNVDKLIIGFNTLDGIVAMPYYDGARPTTDAQYKTFINDYVRNKDHAELIYSHYYPPSDFKQYGTHNVYTLAWWTINADTCLSCPSVYMANQINALLDNGNDMVYVYQFGGPGKNGSYIAPHGSEIPFVFDEGPGSTTFFSMPWNQILSNQMLSAWTNFGKYGLPNITDSIDNFDFEWSLYKPSKGSNESNVK